MRQPAMMASSSPLSSVPPSASQSVEPSVLAPVQPTGQSQDGRDTTTASFQVEDKTPAYLLPRPIPFELVSHCMYYFEESLYNQGLNLLLSLLTSSKTPSSTTAPNAAASSAYTPPPSHLALASTLVVHPTFTNRARTPDQLQASVNALRLLRVTNTIVGPVFAGFGDAFVFTRYKEDGGSGRVGKRKSATARQSTGTTDTNRHALPAEAELSRVLLATPTESLWGNAEDFWHVVGWAMNCSVLHPMRWEVWSVWLGFMCGVMEDDWGERMREGEKLVEERVEEADAPLSEHEAKEMVDQVLRGSLIYAYVARAEGGHGKQRRMMRAIFADGSEKSTGEFGEVFRNETRPPKKQEDVYVKPRKDQERDLVEIDFDKGEFADYLDEQDELSDSAAAAAVTTTKATNGVASSRPQRKRTRTEKVELAEKGKNGTVRPLVNELSLNAMEAIALRKRLMQLLSNLTLRFPSHFKTLSDLYDFYAEFIRDMPLPAFQEFVNLDADQTMNRDSLSALCEYLIFRFIDSKAPSSKEEYVDQQKLELSYLPYAAKTADVDQNARLSILFEALLRLLAGANVLNPSTKLRDAVSKGIEARGFKVMGGPQKNFGTAKRSRSLEWDFLLESAERMRFLVESLPKVPAAV